MSRRAHGRTPASLRLRRRAHGRTPSPAPTLARRPLRPRLHALASAHTRCPAPRAVVGHVRFRSPDCGRRVEKA
nr:hypothetical protein [uncultured Parolsenella sp.]